MNQRRFPHKLRYNMFHDHPQAYQLCYMSLCSNVGQAENNDSLRRVYDSRYLQADCQEPGSAPEPYTW